jgi:hypothetical protein
MLSSRAQAGLEYLMTYGWALVLIAAVVGMLVFIVGAPAQEAQFTSSAPNKFLLKSDTITDEGIAMVVLQNITGGSLTIDDIVEDGSLSDCTIDAGDGAGDSGVVVGAGVAMLLECPYAGSGSGSATINYTNFANLAQTAVIGVGGGTGGTTVPPAAVCGDGAVGGSEECDGVNLNGETCGGLGFSGGSLSCTGSCTFDTSACTSGPVCGDNSCNGAENCSTCPGDCGCGAGQICQGTSCVVNPATNCTGKSEGDPCNTAGTCEDVSGTLYCFSTAELMVNSSFLVNDGMPGYGWYSDPDYCYGFGDGYLTCNLYEYDSGYFGQVFDASGGGTFLISMDISQWDEPEGIDMVCGLDLLLGPDGSPAWLTTYSKENFAGFPATAKTMRSFFSEGGELKIQATYGENGPCEITLDRVSVRLQLPG